MFDDLEDLAEKNMEVQDQLGKVREEHQSKLLEREEAEAECQEVRLLFSSINCTSTKWHPSNKFPKSNNMHRWKRK